MNKIQDREEKIVFDFSSKEMYAMTFALGFLQDFIVQYTTHCQEEKIAPEKAIELIKPVVPELILRFMISDESKNMMLRIKDIVERNIAEMKDNNR